MNYENIQVEKNGTLAVVTLNRPKVLNALNAATFSELDSALDELSGDTEVRVVLLTGAGERAFAAGADIRELAGVNAAEGKAFSLRGQAVFRKLEMLSKPVIACVRGAADAAPLIASGTWEGHIVHAARGTGGFGYDPVFVPTGEERTAAELPAIIKNARSHRAQALTALVAGLADEGYIPAP